MKVRELIVRNNNWVYGTVINVVGVHGTLFTGELLKLFSCEDIKDLDVTSFSDKTIFVIEKGEIVYNCGDGSYIRYPNGNIYVGERFVGCSLGDIVDDILKRERENYIDTDEAKKRINAKYGFKE